MGRKSKGIYSGFYSIPIDRQAALAMLIKDKMKHPKFHNIGRRVKTKKHIADEL